ncbi:MAG TPA: hypothetical protein VMC08_03330, partial [Bacteroidales bacterium]|nr:hypothetical protein [Bacteroidales bacterium]
MRRLFWTFTLLLSAGNLFSQIDNEFWFVAPEVSSNHGDSPVLLRVSTMESPATFTLRMPADLFFAPQTQTLPANSTYTFNLSVPVNWKDTIENRPADQVLKKGLLLTSDSLVTAYYEVNNTDNPAIFPLKGKNALGTEFWITGQNNYANQTNDGSEAFDIVATEDGTRVTITPSIAIVGHAAGVPFQVVLNKGQTYSARTLITTAAATLAGSHVVADKPIAITISDDSIITGGWDLIGDQTIPVNLLGWNYIVIKGYADNIPPSNNDERVYIVAAHDNTDLYIDGGGTPSATLNAGQLYNYGIPQANNTAFFHATEPVYVYHLSGNPGEAGSSIIPEDSCTGSPQVSFVRSTTNFFAMLILTKNGNQDSFYLNGSNSIITGASFAVVPGTGGQWVYYRNSMSTAQVPTGANLLKNTLGKFHLGIINNVGASSEYGYYSAYSSLNLGVDRSICPGDSLRLDGGPYMQSYDWKKYDGSGWTDVGTSRYYMVHDTGFYACMTNGDFCTLQDTIHISMYPDATVSLGPDQLICQGTTTTLDPGPYIFYLWSNGATTRTITTGNGGTYWVRVTNNNGCTARDTVVITLDSLPKPTGALSGPGTVCQGQTGAVYTIVPEMYADSYSWTLPPGYNGASTTNSITLDFSPGALSDTLKVTGINPCGPGPVTKLAVTVDPVPGAAGAVSGASIVCQGQGGFAYSITPVANATSYTWTLPPGATITAGAGSSSILVDYALNASSGNITVYASNNCGNSNTSTFPVTVNLFPVPAGPISGISTVCQGQSGILYSVPAITGADSYIWTLPPGTSITSGSGTNSITVTFDSTLSASGSITVLGHSNSCGDGIASQLAVTVNPLPSPAGTITGASPVCQGQNSVVYTVPPISNASTYVWSVPAGAVISGGAGSWSVTVDFGPSASSGNITVYGQNAICGNGRSSSFPVIVNPQPSPTVSGPAAVCLNSTTTYTTEAGKSNYSWMVSAGGTITGGQGTNSVNILWNATGPQTVTVNFVDANGCTAVSPTVYNITVSTLPVPGLS